MKDFKYYSADGLLGFGFATLSNNYPTIMDNLLKEGKISEKVFSMYLADNFDAEVYKETKIKNSYLVIGGYDVNMIAGDMIVMCPVISNNYWAVGISKITFKGIGYSYSFGSDE